jgi:hypothetical protein
MLSQRQNIDTDFYTYARAIQMAHGKKWKLYARTVYKDILIRLKGRDKLWFHRERIPVEPARVKLAVQEMIVTAKDIERRNRAYPPRSYFYNCPSTCDYHDPCVTEFKGLDIAPLLRDRYEIVPERYAETEDLLSA